MVSVHVQVHEYVALTIYPFQISSSTNLTGEDDPSFHHEFLVKWEAGVRRSSHPDSVHA